MDRTIVVTGASGLLGSSVVRQAASRGMRTVGICNEHVVSYPRIESVRQDIRDAGAVRDLIRDLAPAYIVHCAAYTNVDWCESHPDETWRVNVSASRTLAAAACEMGSSLVYISTDSVFNGETGDYAEDSVPDPINTYARSKLAGERAVQQELPNGLIVRTNLYGWNVQAKQNLAEWALTKLKAGQSVPGFVDVIFSPIFADDLSSILLDMLMLQVDGIYNVSGSDSCSKFNFISSLAREFRYGESLIQPTAIADCADLKAARPKNTTLRTDKVAAVLGRSMPGLEVGLRRFRMARVADLPE